MPKRTDITSILILGAGPIVIGQACEFDYAGAQACKSLREEGYRIILVNSNPATIMTDPNMADATYIEPVIWQTVGEVIRTELPDAILPTMGGQTALNCVLDLEREGILKEFNLEIIGANIDAIKKAENRDLFRLAMQKIGLNMPQSLIAHTLEESLAAQKKFGYPVIIRPSFTMGGSGGGIAYNNKDFINICQRGLYISPICELLIEESMMGWKEYEMEVVRDHKDNCIIICSIENFDPMGVHTGDSITIAPAQTLTDKEYQIMRNCSLSVLREIGINSGGSNVQFAVHPHTGRLIIVEMNPRVSRSSALASKATGFPIAKVAAKLAVGYTLDELSNEITGNAMPASFEPTIDYIVTKVPRFTFEKFPQADNRLSTQMQSVGEVMAIGRSFQESLQKALRGLEIDRDGLTEIIDLSVGLDEISDTLCRELRLPGSDRLWYIADAFRIGFSCDEIQALTHIDRWFLVQVEELVIMENDLKNRNLIKIDSTEMFALKRKGFSDSRLAKLLNNTEDEVRTYRHNLDIRPVYKRVDTCAAEFYSKTSYMYSTYEQECEAEPTNGKKIMILGGGPNRIGQGIEFDYCCVHAALSLREEGYEIIMVNCNPETVSTDYDTSDHLYFESLTLEDILEIVALERPKGVIVQYGGQTPLKLARALEVEGVPIIGTSPEAIDYAEDRERFQQMVKKLDLLQPPNSLVFSVHTAIASAFEIGYPLVVRPSYVLGGLAMKIVYNEDELSDYMKTAIQVSNNSPVLLDRFLDDAIEVDVDAICDGKDVFIAGIMEHIEQAGVHSGDSACALPSYSLNEDIKDRLREQVQQMALELGVVGLMNTQFAIQGSSIFILEVNPRASRTVPYVSKSIGVPLAKIAANCMAGRSLVDQGMTEEIIPKYFSVKEAVFPFLKFQGVDPILGPEMKSTGEVMSVGRSFGEAFAKSQLAASVILPTGGNAFISVREDDKVSVIAIAKDLSTLNFVLLATCGTQKILQASGVSCEKVNKVAEGQPHIVDMIKNNEINLIVNTSEGRQSIADSREIRRAALQHRVNYTTTLAAARATILALNSANTGSVNRLQTLHGELRDIALN